MNIRTQILELADQKNLDRGDAALLAGALTAVLDRVEIVKASGRASDIVLAVEFEQDIIEALNGETT